MNDVNDRPTAGDDDAPGAVEAPHTDPTISIADPRVYLAAERTLLAWIRTSVALIGLGFLVAKFGLFLREIAMMRGMHGGPAEADFAHPPESVITGLLGGSIVIAGAVLTSIAGWEHLRMTRRLRTDDFLGPRRRILAAGLSGIVAAVGLALAAYLWLI